MYNVYRHIAAAMCAAAVAALSMTSCGGNGNNNTEAKAVFDEAKTALNNGNARECIALLDSLDKKYAGNTDIIKESMKLRPQALIKITDEEMLAADSTINGNKATLDSLLPLMIHIDVPGTEGYMLKKSMADANFMNKTGISPRVSEIGEFYLVSSVNPSSGLKHWSVTAVVGDRMATTDTVAYDGALNFRTNNSEVITFTPKGSDEIGRLIADHPDLPVKIIFNGENGKSRSITLKAQQIDGIATAYRYAEAINNMRSATINVERLNTRRAKLLQQIENITGQNSDNTTSAEN